MSDFTCSLGAKFSAYCEALAKELGVDPRDLARALDRCGVVLWASRDGLVSSLSSVERIDSLKEMVEKGMSGRQMAGVMGVSPQRIYQVLHDTDLYGRYEEVRREAREERERKKKQTKEDRKFAKQADLEEASRMWRRGMTTECIARKFNVPRRCMCSRIAEYRKKVPELFPLRRVRKKK